MEWRQSHPLRLFGALTLGVLTCVVAIRGVIILIGAEDGGVFPPLLFAAIGIGGLIYAVRHHSSSSFSAYYALWLACFGILLSILFLFALLIPVIGYVTMIVLLHPVAALREVFNSIGVI
jgi:predicted membrane protein